MPVPCIRADHYQLGQAAQRFGAAADSASATLRPLQGAVQVLDGGDWIGQSAQAFYQEMSQAVLPPCGRLAEALQAADAVPARVQALRFRAENAQQFGYARQGKRFVRVPGPAGGQA